MRCFSSSSPATAMPTTVSPSDMAALRAFSVSRFTVDVGTMTMLSRLQGSGGVRPKSDSWPTSS